MRYIFLAPLLFALPCWAADTSGAVDNVCTAPSIVYEVSAKFEVTADRRDTFLADLERFVKANKVNGFWIVHYPAAPPHINILIANRRSGIEISDTPGGFIVAKSTECGGEDYLPAWRIFVKFLQNRVPKAAWSPGVIPLSGSH